MVKPRWCYPIALAPRAPLYLLWEPNYILVQRSVSQALNADARNAKYSMSAHYGFYVDRFHAWSSTCVTCRPPLRWISRTLPIGRSARIRSSALRPASFLQGPARPVFMMKGEEFGKLGAEFAGGQNPVFLIRTLPEKLYEPTGEAAFGRWEGDSSALKASRCKTPMKSAAGGRGHNNV